MFSNKIKSFFSNNMFRLSDLFLIIGFIPMAVFLIFGQQFMQHPNPNNVALKLSAIIPLFVLLISSWSIYIYLEFKRGNKVNKYINICFVIIATIGAISIAIQPNVFDITFIASNSDLTHTVVNISTTHYFFFILDLISICLFIYIGLFIFPKRFKTINIIQWIGYFVFLGCLFLIIYSYIVERENYIPFIKSLFAFDIEKINQYNMESCIINPNAYGMTLMIGIIFCYIYHSINKKWWIFLLAAFFYINMIFTLCRTSLLISLILTLIYVYIYLISAKGINKKTKTIIISIITTFVILLLAPVAICLLSKGIYFNKLYAIFELLINKNTIGVREIIWDNTYIMLSHSLPLSVLLGKGFGLINVCLLQMNYSCGFDNQLSFPTHNGYLNLFAEGGFIYLFAYISLLFYVIFKLTKCQKKQLPTTFAIAFGMFAFSFYALIETIHYLVYTFMFLVLVYYNSSLIKQKN